MPQPDAAADRGVLPAFVILNRTPRFASLPEVWVLTALSALSHFWHLYLPNVVVFDEFHYEKYIGWYLSGAYMFDVHPPLGRLLYVWFARLTGASVGVLSRPAPAPVLRILPAAIGTLLVPLVFLLLRQLGATRKVSTIAAVAVLLDNALLVTGRTILVDIFLIVFGVGAMTMYLAGRKREGRPRWLWFAGAALLAGMALSVKWTGASALGVILAAWFIELLLERAPLKKIVGEGLLLTSIPLLVYLAAFAIHFAVLWHSGPGDNYMSARFRRQLPGSAQFDPKAPHESFWTKLGEVHHAIRYGNGQLENATNPLSSRWYTWPIMKHPFAMWGMPRPRPGTVRVVAFLGNPVVWWGALTGFAVTLAAYARRRKQFAGRHYGFALLLGAVLLNYLPFMGIRRLMYLYHYLFALTMLIAFAAYGIGILAGWMDEDPQHPWRFPSRRSAMLYAGMIGLIVVSFVYFSPLTYGWELTHAQYDARFWVLHPHF